MPQPLGTVPHTEPINIRVYPARCRTRQQLRKDVLQGIKIKVLHAQPPRPVHCTVHVNLDAGVTGEFSIPHPENDPASITVLDRPPIAPTGCTLLGARVHYASYMRKALANAYVSPTLKLSLEGYLCTSTFLHAGHTAFDQGPGSTPEGIQGAIKTPQPQRGGAKLYRH